MISLTSAMSSQTPLVMSAATAVEVLLCSLSLSSGSMTTLLPLLFAIRGLKLLHAIYENRIERVKPSDCLTVHARIALFFVLLLALDGAIVLNVLDVLDDGRGGNTINGNIALVLATDIMTLPVDLWRGTAAYFLGLHLATFDETCSPRKRQKYRTVLYLTMDAVKLLNQVALLSCLEPATHSTIATAARRRSSSSDGHSAGQSAMAYAPLAAWQVAKTLFILFYRARALRVESLRVKTIIDQLPSASATVSNSSRSFCSSSKPIYTFKESPSSTISVRHSATLEECCLICREDIADDTDEAATQHAIKASECGRAAATAKRLSCNHAFHAACLSAWLDVRLQCPTCRKAV